MHGTFNTLFVAFNPIALIPPGTRSASREIPGIDTPQLRWRVLAPVIFVILAIAGALTTKLYFQATDGIASDMQALDTSANQLYQAHLNDMAGMLAGVTESISRNPLLRNALLKKNHAELSKYILPEFATLQTEYGITLLDVTGADRTVLLRGQNPGYFADVTNRATVLAAQRTRSPAHGVEPGANGDLELRFVRPVYGDTTNSKLIGFIEAGINVNALLMDMQKSMGIQIFEFVSKDSISREVWQQSMPNSASSAEWDRFRDAVPGSHARKTLTLEMSVSMSGMLSSSGTTMNISRGNSEFHALSFPILDIEQHKVGSVVMLADVTARVMHARNMVYLGLALGVAGSGLLFSILWLWTDRVGRLLEQHRTALQNLATRDGLTGLFNHTTFFTLLEDEVTRSHRSGIPVSLLVLDIDYSRHSDIKFAHAIDSILNRELGNVIHRQSRSIDKVCRYGDQKIAVILTETNASQALVAAERTRGSIREYFSESDQGQVVAINVSIGVASVPENATSAQELAYASEHALQIDKERGRIHSLPP
jgi:diguanylate cyclase (GGDEF)-like protein